MLRSTAKFNKGEFLEKNESVKFHMYGKPILISQKLLRSKNMGQIDLCRYINGTIEIAEVKATKRISGKQRARLGASANYLSSLFNKNSKIILIHAAH